MQYVGPPTAVLFTRRGHRPRHCREPIGRGRCPPVGGQAIHPLNRPIARQTPPSRSRRIVTRPENRRREKTPTVWGPSAWSRFTGSGPTFERDATGRFAVMGGLLFESMATPCSRQEREAAWLDPTSRVGSRSSRPADHPGGKERRVVEIMGGKACRARRLRPRRPTDTAR